MLKGGTYDFVERIHSKNILGFILYSKLESFHKSRQSLGGTISHKVTVINSMSFKISCV